MRPVLLARSHTDDDFLELLVASISSVDCAGHFANHLGQPQAQQASVVRSFQRALVEALLIAFPAMTWRAEHQLPTGRDTIDIFGHGFADVVIELDKSRADQVAKKFVSRSAMSVGKIYYVSLCYPGTTHMNVPECIKYFGFCATLSKRIGNVYAGFIVQQTQLGIEDFCVFQ